MISPAIVCMSIFSVNPKSAENKVELYKNIFKKPLEPFFLYSKTNAFPHFTIFEMAMYNQCQKKLSRGVIQSLLYISV